MNDTKVYQLHEQYGGTWTVWDSTGYRPLIGQTAAPVDRQDKAKLLFVLAIRSSLK